MNLLQLLTQLTFVLSFITHIPENDIVPPVTEDFDGVYNNIDSTSFNRAWEDNSKPIIIDAYKLNTIDWEKLSSDDRVIGVIHKSSEGLIEDSKYLKRRKKAKELGYKWGSYHLGRKGNPVQQADYYLDCVVDAKGELLALDLENLDSKKYMTLKEAELFVERIYEKTNRYPIIYCNNSVLKEISDNYGKESVFSKCALWYARFSPTINNFDNRLWKSYTLWQFSSELNCERTGDCLYNVPGTKYDMDINVYNGNTEDIINKWPNI